MGITAGLTGLLGVALAIAPVSPSLATRAPSGDGAATVSAGALLRAKAAKPAVTKLAPQSGTTAGGFDVVIKGRDLTDVKRVLFGSAQATDVRARSGHKLVVRAPAHEAGVVPVRVVTKHGSSKQSAATKFTYVNPVPSLASLSPRTGPATGGTTVTLAGSGLSGATSVHFGSTAAAFHVVSPTTITATTPARPAGPVNVTVTTPGGTAALDDSYSFVAAPTLSFVAPGSGPTDGATVTLSGAGFTSDAAVTFGGLAATNVQVFAGGTSLTARTPDDAPGWVDVAVTTPGGTATLTRGYLFVGGVTLTGVSPALGPTAGFVDVTLTGTGFTPDTLVVFGTKPSLDVTVGSGGTQLTALLPPQGAGTVDVLVSTEGDTDTLAAAFTYVVAPTLTTVSPIAGPVTAGTTVTLTGTGFRAGMQVSFGGVAATGVSVLSPTQATVTAPAHAPGAVNVTVTTPGGSATVTNGYTYVAAPTLTVVNPNEGPIVGGTTVTLTGTGFRAGMTVSFGGAAGTGLSITSATSLSVTAPAHAAGAVNVVVTTPGGSATLANSFTYLAAPILSSVTPAAGPVAGGTSVTLAGSGFRTGMTVSFGGLPATGIVVTPGGAQLTAVTPAHGAGAVSVSVTTPGGSDTLGTAYTYVVLPALTNVLPNAGPTAGGTTVTLTGSGFQAGMQVLFGTTPATGVSVNSDGTELTATTPPHVAGAVGVSVSTPGGSATLPNGYTYLSVPTVTAVTPDAGPVAGGTTVTLTGTGFRAGMQVFLGSVAATGVAVTPGGTSLTATAPAHSAGGVDVSVTTPGGSATFGNSYTYLAPPTVTSVSPVEGPAAGGTTATVNGSGFWIGMQVRFGGVLASVVSINPAGTILTATNPAHAAGAVAVSVTTPGGADTLTNAFTYVAAPTLTAVSPGSGPAAGGTTLTLTGTGFRTGMQVSVGGTPAAIVTVDPGGTSLTATAPAHAPGLVGVSVTTPGGSDTLASSFTYLVAPTLTSITPTDGPAAGGTPVTLTGTGLTGTTAVTLGGVPATDVTVLNDTTVTATTPAHAAGAVDVSVTTPGGGDTLTNAFTYLAAPILLSVAPADGPAAGGTSVTLTGTGLIGTTGVTFDGLAATDLLVVDDSTVTVTSPAHAVGAVDVSVTTPGGTGTATGGFTYLP